MEMSSKMQKNPSIRFKGFTDAWEQRKLGSIYQFQYGHFNNNPDNGGIYPIYGANGIIGGYHGFNAENSVVIGHMGAYAGHVLWVEGKHFVTYNGTIGFPKDLNFDRKFGFHMLQHINIPKITAGSGQPFVSYSDLENIKLYISDSIDEQNKLGYFFDMLENTIALHQRELDNLKITKQVFMKKMFPKEGEKVPEVRFPGFMADWDYRKLGDVGETYTGLSGKSKDDFGHGRGKYVTYMNVFSNSIANPSLVELVEIDTKQNEVNPGDIFFTTSSETPAEVGMSSVWLENSDNTYLNSFCFGYRPIEKFDNYYLAYMLRSSVVRKKITFLAQGISRYNISKNKVMDIAVPIPVIEEQTKIGEFFKQLDDIINLQQQELEKLKQTKQAFLQKMFI